MLLVELNIHLKTEKKNCKEGMVVKMFCLVFISAGRILCFLHSQFVDY